MHYLLYFSIIVISILFYYYYLSFNPHNIEKMENLGSDLVGSNPRGKGENSPFLRTKIWENVLAKYGNMQAEAIFPKTYILPKDNVLFLKEETSHKEYIAKTLYSGGRVGVFLYEPSMKKNLHDFAVIQEYIGNPLLINGFKFDTRLFMVIDCKKGAFLYKPGYNVYTAKRFQYKSKDRDRKINQAYAGDDHYDIHNLPRTTSELFMYHVPYDQIIYDVAMKLRKIILATPTDICPMKTSIYGVDMEILDDFDSKIIEINSKPSTRFKKTPWKNELTRALRDEMGSYDSCNWIKIAEPCSLTESVRQKQ